MLLVTETRRSVEVSAAASSLRWICVAAKWTEWIEPLPPAPQIEDLDGSVSLVMGGVVTDGNL